VLRGEKCYAIEQMVCALKKGTQLNSMGGQGCGLCQGLWLGGVNLKAVKKVQLTSPDSKV
jgi:hypothetical protein